MTPAPAASVATSRLRALVPTWHWANAAAVALGLISVLFNLVYLLYLCPHDLAPDEAHYWDWSRHLDWCYYSKGPLVAWLIRGCGLLFGDSVLAIRLPPVVCGGLILLGLWKLARKVVADPRFALLVLVVAVSLPAFAVASAIGTIDPPYLACWVWATLAALHHRWAAAGVLVAVGTLAKYTMLLFPVCVGLWAVFDPSVRSPRLWLVFFVSLLGLVPIAVWNATHDWVGVEHLLGYGRGPTGGSNWLNPLAFVGGQLAVLLGVWFAAWVAEVWLLSPFSPTESAERVAVGPGVRVAVWTSAPVFVVFFLASVKTAGEPNWPAAAYLGGLVLAVKWVWDRRQVRWVRATAAGAVGLGLMLGIVLRWPQTVRPALNVVCGTPNDDQPAPVRRLDPTARLAGWRTLAAEVDRLRDEYRQDDPLIATMTWTVPGELGYYCTGHPMVYSFGPALADRASQYDLWRPNPVLDAQAFRGRTFVYVGEKLPDGAFASAACVASVTHTENGVPLAAWKIWLCRDFQGFPPRTAAARF